MDAPGLNEEQRAALVRAARMAGDRTLAAELERLALSYKQERRAGKPPTMGEVRRRLLARAAEIEALRRALRGDPWAALATGEVRDLPMPEIVGIDLDCRLAREARRARAAAANIPLNDRRPADRQPGTPLWRLLWATAELWAGAGNTVTIGVSGRFFAFANQVVDATGDTLAERLANEVARQWRKANGLTEEPQKTPLLSLVS